MQSPQSTQKTQHEAWANELIEAFEAIEGVEDAVVNDATPARTGDPWREVEFSLGIPADATTRFVNHRPRDAYIINADLRSISQQMRSVLTSNSNVRSYTTTTPDVVQSSPKTLHNTARYFVDVTF